MKTLCLLGFVCLSFLQAHCHRREPINILDQGNPVQTLDGSETSVDSAPPLQEGEPSHPIATDDHPIPDTDMMSKDVPVPSPESQRKDRIESLRFSHETSLCLRAPSNATVTLQPCDPQSADQKFLFARSLDGRFQLQVMGTQMCLGLRAGNLFFPTLLVTEACESKASQFFNAVVQDSMYSLRFDANSTCLDAENNSRLAGTRVILFRCTAAPNQRFLMEPSSPLP